MAGKRNNSLDLILGIGFVLFLIWAFSGSGGGGNACEGLIGSALDRCIDAFSEQPFDPIGPVGP